jgi:hypothetical protein
VSEGKRASASSFPASLTRRVRAGLLPCLRRLRALAIEASLGLQLEQLAAHHGYFARRLDAELDDPSLHFQDSDPNVVTDQNGLPSLAGKDEHREFLRE